MAVPGDKGRQPGPNRPPPRCGQQTVSPLGGGSASPSVPISGVCVHVPNMCRVGKGRVGGGEEKAEGERGWSFYTLLPTNEVHHTRRAKIKLIIIRGK